MSSEPHHLGCPCVQCMGQPDLVGNDCACARCCPSLFWLGIPITNGARRGPLKLERWQDRWHVILGEQEPGSFGPGKNVIIAGPLDKIDALTRAWLAPLVALGIELDMVQEAM